MRFQATWLRWSLLAAGILVSSGILAWLDQNPWIGGWGAYSLTLGLGVGSLALGWHVTSRDTRAVQIAAIAFVLRLTLGVALTLVLPGAGYQESEATLAGYAYSDAHQRDRDAWRLAKSDQPVWSAFTNRYQGDQYGGMLTISAWVYRMVSPEAHRPWLILVLSASASAWGVLFLWKATQDWFDEPVTRMAAWIFALYPESVLLGASQMREAFLIPAIAMGFFGLSDIQQGRITRWPWVLGSAVVLVFFSPPFALAFFIFLIGAWALDPMRQQSWKTLALFGLVLVIMVFVASTVLSQYPALQGSGPIGILLDWIQKNANFQRYRLLRESGWVQKLVRDFSDLGRLGFILGYGFAQPVLPAALVVPAAWIWRLIGSLRAAGWYVLAPLLVYGLTRLPSTLSKRRWQLTWLGIVIWGWILGSVFIAGGDQWDNPRYRATFIAGQAIFAAWAWVSARRQQDRWLWRWLMVEGVFVLGFLSWYISRYTDISEPFNFWVVSGMSLGVSGVILIGGWLRDRSGALSR